MGKQPETISERHEVEGPPKGIRVYKDMEDESNTEYGGTVNIKERSEWGGKESEEKARTRPQKPSLLLFFLPIRTERH